MLLADCIVSTRVVWKITNISGFYALGFDVSHMCLLLLVLSFGIRTCGAS